MVYRLSLRPRPARSSAPWPRWLALLALVCAVAFAPSAATAQESARTVSFDVPLSRSAAIERAKTALASQGYTIASVYPSVITTNLHDVEQIIHVRIFAKFFALDTALTRVVVTGEYSIEMAQPDPANIEEASRGIAGDAWNELQLVGDKIRQVSTTP